MSSTTFTITNITCAACIKLSTMALEGIDGVMRATVDMSGAVTLLSTREIAWDDIQSALCEVGKEAVILH